MHFQKLLLEFILNSVKLSLSLGAADAAGILYLPDFIQRGNKLFVGLFKGLQINNAALRLLSDANAALMQSLSVL